MPISITYVPQLNSLRGDWRINGRRGHIYAAPGGFQIYFIGSARGWAYTKSALSFASVTQDGDADGCLFLSRLPTATEGATIRKRIGILQKRKRSNSELTRLRNAALDTRFRRKEPPPPVAPLPT